MPEVNLNPDHQCGVKVGSKGEAAVDRRRPSRILLTECRESVMMMVVSIRNPNDELRRA
jgi:hypothetical protein